MIEPSLLLVTLLYMGLVVAYGVAQDRHAQRYLERPPRPVGRQWPSVDVVLPCYNEDPDVLAKCCESLDRLEYRGTLRFFLVDDGSTNRDALEHVYRRYQRRRHWTVMKRPRLGKREAQTAAIRRGIGELVVTVDSDTVLAPDALRRLVPAFAERDVGAVTGDVRALNWDHNWLTRVLDERYRLLFEQERAAQSHVGAVLCCSGPFSAYRREAVKAVLKSYREQTFLGLPCITGDDIHLTNLVLAGNRYRSVYEPSAKAWTIVPTSLPRYARQQSRWNRSFYRELVPTLRAIQGRSPYLLLDVMARLMLPPLLATGLVMAGMHAIDGHALGGLLSVAAMGIAGGGLLSGKTANPRPNYAFVLRYGAIYLLMLILVRFWALATLRGNGWGTRGAPRRVARVARKRTRPVPPRATTNRAAEALA